MAALVKVAATMLPPNRHMLALRFAPIKRTSVPPRSGPWCGTIAATTIDVKVKETAEEDAWPPTLVVN
jgi:hypothetical protein